MRRQKPVAFIFVLAWIIWATFNLDFASAQSKADQAEQLARTPPMGWNSWNHFHRDITEKLIMEEADAMVASGMKESGYEYINLDDCWMALTRNKEGNLHADPKRFPHGMKYLADYIHKKGLKIGLYSSAG